MFLFICSKLQSENKRRTEDTPNDTRTNLKPQGNKNSTEDTVTYLVQAVLLKTKKVILHYILKNCS